MLSERLRIAMKQAGINQAELARACDVKPPSVNGWLSGKSRFLRGENLLKAAKALGVSELWLAEGKGQMRRNVYNESTHTHLSEPQPTNQYQPTKPTLIAPKTNRQRRIEEIISTLDAIDDEGLAVVLYEAKKIAQAHPVEKQTRASSA